MTASQLLSFAARARLAEGFGYLRSDGTVDPSKPLETWISARMTHVFSLAAIAGHCEAASLAQHGIEALLGPLRDSVHGGWFTSVPGDGHKSAYQHAFVVLAGASATQAGVVGGSGLLQDALAVWDERFWDDKHHAAVDEWDRRWKVCAAYRGANANMHGVEAMLAAAEAVGEPQRSSLLKRCLAVVQRLVHGEARSRDWRLPEHFTSEWEPLLEHNRDRPADPFQPYGVTVGHQFEWARLAVHLHHALGTVAPAWLLEDARGLFQAAHVRGWSPAPTEGFAYTLDWEDQPVVTARMHWVLAEALASASVLSRVFDDDHYRDLHRNWSALAARTFADPTTGNWHHELTPDGSPAETTWTGQPDAYHVYQALLIPELPNAGSLAGALRLQATTRGSLPNGSSTTEEARRR